MSKNQKKSGKSVSRMSKEETLREAKSEMRKFYIIFFALAILITVGNFVYRQFGYRHVTGTVIQASEVLEQRRNLKKPYNSKNKGPTSEKYYIQNLLVSVGDEEISLENAKVSSSGYQAGDTINIAISKSDPQDMMVE